MQARLSEQWRSLTRQDQERRELVANISHDLRTPLASLHGYLETLSLKDATLSVADRRRYLGIALDQSRKVGGLAQSLLELVRLEHGFVQPVLERFSLTDLVQDIFQKFELTAEARQVQLKANFASTVSGVFADLGLIERVLTNLFDNALRHTPVGGIISISLVPQGGFVEITVSDSGPGIAAQLREGCFCGRSTLAARGGMADWGCELCSGFCSCMAARFVCWMCRAKGRRWCFRCQWMRKLPRNWRCGR